MVSSITKTKGMKKSLIGFIFIIFILGWLLNQNPLKAQSSSLNGKEYTVDFYCFEASGFQYGKYLYSKNLATVHLHFEESIDFYWDTTIIIQPNSIFPMFGQNNWFYLYNLFPQLIRISSSDSLFVIGSTFEMHSNFCLQYEACANFPKHHSGNQYIIPGVYQSTPRNIFIYPVDENTPINFTLTANANDTLFPDIAYNYTIIQESYRIRNDLSNYWWGNFILDSLMPNSLAGSTVGVENCKQIRVQGSDGSVASYPHQYSSDPLVSQLCNQMLSTAGSSTLQAFNTTYEDLFPTNTMGQKYICSPPSGGFEIVSFTAPYNNTVISIDGMVWDTLNARECRIKLFKESAYIEASLPISLVISHSFMKDSVGWFWGGGGMIQLPALEQTATSGWFFYPALKFIRENAPPDYIDEEMLSWSDLNSYLDQEKSDIIVVTPTIGVNQTLLNNVNIGAIFQPIAGNSQYSSARIEINTGFNEISNPNGLIVWSTSYQTLTDSLAPYGNYICSGAPLVMSFNKPTYEAKIGVVPIDSTLVEAYTICLNTELQFSVNSSNNSDIYINTWEFGDGHTAVGDTVFHSFADTGYFHINLFVNNFCDTIKGLVYVVSPPEFSLGNDTIICANIPLILDATLPENASYLWNNGNTNPQITVDAIGEYIVEVHTESACYVTDTINIDMYDPINLFLGNDTILCYLSSLVLDATQTPKAEANYMWQDYSTNSTYTVIYEGQYWVVVENLCTQERDTINVEELMHPELNLGNDTLICIGNTLLIDATIPWGISYVWENGTSGAFRHIESEGLYWIVASNPCVSVIDSIFVNFDDCGPVLFIPNTFSPNSDGLNDVFEIGAIKNISKLNIMIFNRWGQKLFESNSANFEWNGKYNGKECPEGVYYWVINYEDIFGKSHEANGTVSLLR